ncbi:DEAD/DEAH box helicase, partial [bacterium]|nr:DEAD/DEAH box helicase [bacterium]
SKAGRIFSYLIAGHHAGLPDWLPDETGNAALSVRLKEITHLETIKKAKMPTSILEKNLPKERPPKGADPALWIRMLFSCLVDADFLDTEAFMDKKRFLLRGNYPAIAELLESFTKFMAERYTPKADDTSVNYIRDNILRRCIGKAVEAPGAFTLSVPTGGGKTLSSMAFALHHASHHEKRRIIYVIPYISIVEQTADQFQKIYGDAVVEHHANFDPTEENDEYTKRRLACENWDAPIIVTTAVQFFESLFASRTSRCRKLHNIVNSVVILDEAQLLPPEFLNPILRALDELRKHYGVTLVLSTATQPALLPHNSPSFTFEGLSDTREIIENPELLNKQLKRVHVAIFKSLDEPLEWEVLRNKLMEHDSVLCVVNRRDDCRKLWQLMPEGTFHLSALMCGAHRSEVIAAIKKNLKEGIPTRVISTQLVEAGVD